MWYILDVHIFIFLNSNNQTYIGMCVIKSGLPSIFLWRSREHSPHISTYNFIMFFAFWIPLNELFYFLHLYHDHDGVIYVLSRQCCGSWFFYVGIGSFVSFNNTRMSSGMWNPCSTYCFSFSLNFLNWYFSYLCSLVVTKTVQNSSTSPLGLLFEGVFFVRLKRPPHPP